MYSNSCTQLDNSDLKWNHAILCQDSRVRITKKNKNALRIACISIDKCGEKVQIHKDFQIIYLLSAGETQYRADMLLATGDRMPSLVCILNTFNFDFCQKTVFADFFKFINVITSFDMKAVKKEHLLLWYLILGNYDSVYKGKVAKKPCKTWIVSIISKKIKRPLNATPVAVLI